MAEIIRLKNAPPPKKPRKSKSANGAGGIRCRSDGRYEARLVIGYQDNGKPKRISIYGATEKEVRRKLTETKYQLDTGTYCDKDNTTFVSWMLIWLDVYAKPSIKPSTYTSYKTYINGHLVPYFHNIKLQDLQPDRLQQFLNYKSTGGRLDGKEGGNSAKTILNIKNMIHAALKQACINGMISRNIADLVKTPKQVKKEMRVLTIEEQTAIEKAALSDRHGIPIILALYTGMRVGEVLALKYDDIQLEGDNPVIHVRSSIKREYKEGVIPNTAEYFGNRDENKTVLMRSSPKTYTSIRDIPLIPEAVEILQKQRRYTEEDKSNDGIAYKDYGFVFSNSLGYPYDQRTYADNFNRIVRAAGIDKTIQLGTREVSIGFHTLRHTFATRAVENGMDILVLSKILGHAQASTTLNKYGHVLADHLRSSMEKMRPIK